MTKNNGVQSDGLEKRELSMDEIDAASGAGIRDVVRFIKCLFGGCEQLRQGANIGQNTDSARLGNYVKGLAVMNGPYFTETLDDVAKLGKRRPSRNGRANLRASMG